MTARRLQLALLLSSLTVTLMAFGPPAKSVSVTSTIDDNPTVQSQPDFQIKSDGSVYADSKTLTSQLQSGGANWVLDALSSSPARFMKLDLTGMGLGSAVSPVPPGSYPFRMVSNCSLYGNSMIALPAGTSRPCPLHIVFVYNGSQYALEMNDQQIQMTETNPATVTCASGTNPCAKWTITPYSDGNTTLQYNVAKLLRYTTSKGQTVAVDQGDFYVSFHFTITNP
jgi:hypothetical protein